MARTIAVFNQKGGVGKTTSCLGLSSYLAFFGKRILLVDFDPQSNATIGAGINYENSKTIYHSMFFDVPIEETVRQTPIFNFEVVPSSRDLAGAIIELANVQERENHLRRTLENIKHNYDYILIDMAPSLSLLSINGLMAADEVLIPIQCEYFSLQGLNQLLDTIQMVNQNLGHNLKISGVLLTMYEEGDEFSEKIAREIKEKFPHYVFKTIIPKSKSLSRAPSEQRPILMYDPRSSGAQGYESLARELIAQEENNLSTDEHHLTSFFN